MFVDEGFGLLDTAASNLNALIYLNEDKAMAAARQVDMDRAAGKRLGALAGLPIVVKDNINTKGMKTTGGTFSLRNFQPKQNAPSLLKLVDAGAIILGKSNLHEWAFGITSTNLSDFGVVRNPYDPSRIPGGSSGGTAVAIAVGMVLHRHLAEGALQRRLVGSALDAQNFVIVALAHGRSGWC